MVLSGPNVTMLFLVFESVKLIWLADMRVLRGERTIALLIALSNTTRGKPPSTLLYTESFPHTPDNSSLATAQGESLNSLHSAIGEGSENV